MKTIYIMPLALTLAYSTSLFAVVKMPVRTSAISNLIYELTCISTNSLRCSKNIYRELWKKEFLHSKVDQTLLDSWGDLIKKYDRSISLNDKNKGQVDLLKNYKLRHCKQRLLMIIQKTYHSL